MKIIKKLLSAACAVAMLTGVASSMAYAAMSGIPVVPPEDVTTIPTLKVAAKEYDESTKSGTFSVSLEDLDQSILPDTVIDQYFIESMQFGLKFDPTQFDVSKYVTTGRPAPIASSMTINSALKKAPELGFPNNTLNFVWVDTDINTSINSYNGFDMSSVHLYDLKFTITAEDKVTIGIGDVMVEGTTYADDFVTEVNGYLWGNMKDCYAMNYDLPEIGGIEWVIPDNTGNSSAGADKIVTVPGGDAGGVFVPTDDNAGDTDRAIAKAVNLDPSGKPNVVGVKWVIDRTPAGGVAETVQKTFPLPNVEVSSQITMGIVIGYDATEYENVTVQSAGLVTAN